MKVNDPAMRSAGLRSFEVSIGRNPALRIGSVMPFFFPYSIEETTTF
jgi:hypothetical protein